METLNVRPGLTGAGQILYTQMQQAPASDAEDPEQHYITHELHAKLGFDLDYLRRRSLGYDLTLVLRTVLLLVGLNKTHSHDPAVAGLRTIARHGSMRDDVHYQQRDIPA